MTFEQVLGVKQRHRDALMAIDGVVNVGIGVRSRRFVLRVYTDRDGVVLPAELDGVSLLEISERPYLPRPQEAV